MRHLSAPTLGHNGSQLVIALPNGQMVPIEAPRVREAKIALARVMNSKPSPATAEQLANWTWRVRAAKDTYRNEMTDVMADYGLYFDKQGNVAVDGSRWPYVGETTVAADALVAA